MNETAIFLLGCLVSFLCLLFAFITINELRKM
jgi:hypothetical protein